MIISKAFHRAGSAILKRTKTYIDRHAGNALSIRPKRLRTNPFYWGSHFCGLLTLYSMASGIACGVSDSASPCATKAAIDTSMCVAGMIVLRCFAVRGNNMKEYKF